MRIHLCATSLLLLLSLPLSAQQTSTDSSHTAAAAELVEVLELEAGFEREMLDPPPATGDPRAEEAYRMQVALFQEFLPWSELQPEYVKIYKGVYSEREIRELIEFYRTPLGRKVVTMRPEITRELKLTMDRLMLPHMDEILDRMMERMLEATGNVGASAPATAQVDLDERGVARAVANVIRAFVAEHTGVPAGPLVLDTTYQLMAHSRDAYSEAEPFPPGERRALADELDWEIANSSDLIVCEERCLLRDNMIVFNLSRPTIRGDEAVVSFSWHHNFAGVIRQNRRVVEMARTRGQRWAVVDVLGCVHSTGGGSCALPRDPGPP